ncbi:VPA1269 family protein [Acinetobacter sp. ANC 5378]|uniref:VPA1269 family protein n=1 Tax=Acinetobacter sp. ANC 5378 TaxID=2731249 RepID=UPI00148F85B7|nr:VPA1269 family protein [Acinetobacter sp. ANC 5378]NNG83162.1 hypothetical protein [Acinetobacter sp. ANC 5378]
MLKVVDKSDKVIKEVNQGVAIWERYADDWLKTKDKGIKDKRAALKIFRKTILDLKIKNLSEINIFLMYIKNNIEIFEGELNKYLAHLTQKNKTLYKNNIIIFLDWVSEEVGVDSPFAQDEILDWFENIKGINWKNWADYLNEYNNINEIKRWKDIKYLFNYIIFKNEEFSDVYFFLNEKKGSTQVIKKELIAILRNKTKLSLKTIWGYTNSAEHFLNWLLVEYYPQLVESQEDLIKRNLQEEKFITNAIGHDWIGIQDLVNEWLCEQSIDIIKDKSCFKRFFKNISQKDLSSNNFFEIFNKFKGYNYLFNLMIGEENLNHKFINSQCKIIIKFCDWLILNNKLPLLKGKVINPYKKRNKSFLSDFEGKTGDSFKEWINLAEDWIFLDENKIKTKKRVIKTFFTKYLIVNDNLCSDVNLYIRKIEKKEILIEDIYKSIFNNDLDTTVSLKMINEIIDFIKFIVKYKSYSYIEIVFSVDKFKWLVLENGAEWNEWKDLANEWINLYKDSSQYRKTALNLFFKSFLLKKVEYRNVIELFKNHNIDINNLMIHLKIESNANNKVIKRYVNFIVRFLDWIIANKLNGDVCNPFFYLSAIDIEPVHIYIKNLGNGWEVWSKYVEEWIKLQGYSSQVKFIPIIRKFIKYLSFETPFRYDVDALLNPESCQNYVTRKKYKYFLIKNGVSEGTANFNITIITLVTDKLNF